VSKKNLPQKFFPQNDFQRWFLTSPVIEKNVITHFRVKIQIYFQIFTLTKVFWGDKLNIILNVPLETRQKDVNS